jgi:YebC/PmpR family DNA-binding regulatory protein
MARHSKWHKVRQFKGAIDAKRAASFTKLAHEITVAIERAKKASMTRDTIERAVQRGAGGSGEGQLESPVYEAYAPGGTALIIECVTDNKNRSTNDVKHLVTKAEGTLASAGSVTYLFDRVGVVSVGAGFPRPGSAGMPEGAETAPLPENVELLLIDAGATDIVPTDEGFDIRCLPSDLAAVADAVGAIHELPLHIDSAEFEWIPKATVETDETTGLAVSELIDQLDSLDDVSRVYSNLA